MQYKISLFNIVSLEVVVIYSGEDYMKTTPSTSFAGLQPIPRDSNNKDVAAMLVEQTIEATVEALVSDHLGNSKKWS